MNTTNYLVIYSKGEGCDNELLGFRIFEKDEATTYMKCVKLLSENNEVFEANDSQEYYVTDDFSKIKISPSEIKVLAHLFGIDENGEKIGIFPDAINDAYDHDLINDDEDENYDENDDF